MLQPQEMDQKKSNCSCDVFLWKILGDVDHVKSNCS